jgi:hypothetical protein
MNDLEIKLRGLKLKKALLITNIESLSEVNDSLYMELGKVTVEIWNLKTELIRQTENIIK